MHEMSIAENIIGIVVKESARAGSDTVAELELEIGLLAGVEYDALEFALKVIAPGSIIDSSKLVIHKPGGKAVCNECGFEFKTSQPVNCCDSCSSYDCAIIQGKELRIKSILIE